MEWGSISSHSSGTTEIETSDSADIPKEAQSTFCRLYSSNLWQKTFARTDIETTVCGGRYTSTDFIAISQDRQSLDEWRIEKYNTKSGQWEITKYNTETILAPFTILRTKEYNKLLVPVISDESMTNIFIFDTQPMSQAKNFQQRVLDLDLSDYTSVDDASSCILADKKVYCFNFEIGKCMLWDPIIDNSYLFSINVSTTEIDAFGTPVFCIFVSRLKSILIFVIESNEIYVYQILLKEIGIICCIPLFLL